MMEDKEMYKTCFKGSLKNHLYRPRENKEPRARASNFVLKQWDVLKKMKTGEFYYER